jgi:hypothetical protein
MQKYNKYFCTFTTTDVHYEIIEVKKVAKKDFLYLKFTQLFLAISSSAVCRRLSRDQLLYELWEKRGEQ